MLAGAERARGESALRASRHSPAWLRHGSSGWRLGPREIAEVAPPPQVWDRIAAALPAQAQRNSGLWQSLAFWRGFALATGALAAACIAALIYFGPATRRQPLIAAIDGGGHHHFVATVDARRGTIAVVPAAFSPTPTPRAGIVADPADGKPRSLGLMRVDRTVTIAVPPISCR